MEKPSPLLQVLVLPLRLQRTKSHHVRPSQCCIFGVLWSLACILLCSKTRLIFVPPEPLSTSFTSLYHNPCLFISWIFSPHCTSCRGHCFLSQVPAGGKACLSKADATPAPVDFTACPGEADKTKNARPIVIVTYTRTETTGSVRKKNSDTLWTRMPY